MAEKGQKGIRTGGLLRVVLVCSLALNLAVIGAVVGALVSGRMGEGPPRSIDLGVGPVARALTPEERREVVRGLRQDRVMRDLDLRGRIDGMLAVLKADPYDPDLFRALMQERAAQVTAVQAKAQDAFLETIAQMTPERRAAFADALALEMSKERPRRGPQGSGG